MEKCDNVPGIHCRVLEIGGRPEDAFATSSINLGDRISEFKAQEVPIIRRYYLIPGACNTNESTGHCSEYDGGNTWTKGPYYHHRL